MLEGYSLSLISDGEIVYMSSRSSFRGGYAPRRGRGRWINPLVHAREYSKPDIQKNPLGMVLKTFQLSDLNDHVEQNLNNVEISAPHYVASYNWLNNESPTIMVPGKPPHWTPLQHARRLKEDNGEYFRDPNAARFPEYPIAPVVKAIISTKPEFSTSNVDLVACGSTLGSLLRFARGIDRAFRFDVEVIGNSVFFVRKENDPKEIIPDVRGFGHSFPEAYTTWDEEVKGSETHQRIIQYDFAGLNCLVRFECDGYLDTAPDKIADAGDQAPIMMRRFDNYTDDVLGALSKTSIARKNSYINHTLQNLKVETGGSEVSQDCLFDLKTRSGKHKREIDMTDIYPLLWIKRIPHFIVAYHDGAGKFEEIREKNVQDEVRNWERENVQGIHHLALLLRIIVSYVKAENALLEVYCPGAHRLEIRKQFGVGRHALPRDLSVEWQRRSETFADSDSDDGGLRFNENDEQSSMWDHALEDGEPDYTACSVEHCGYCGKCTY